MPPPAPQHTSKSGCLRDRGHAGLVSAQPGPTVPRRPHFQPLQGRGSPQSLTPSPPLPDPHPQGDHSSPHTSALPGPGPSPKKRKKIHGTHRLRPCSSPHSAPHTLRAAQARVAVRKWSGARLGARGRGRVHSSLVALDPEADADWPQCWPHPLSWLPPAEGITTAWEAPRTAPLLTTPAPPPPGPRVPNSASRPPLIGCGAELAPTWLALWRDRALNLIGPRT